MLHKNMSITLVITELNNLGFGVARVEGQVVFVSGALDGEVVEATILKVTKSYAIAKMMRIIQASPHRIADPCMAKGCGGCVYGSVSYAHELSVKQEGVVQAFAKAGIHDAVVLPVKTTDTYYHYRNKAQYPVSKNADGTCRIGFYAPKSHRVIEASDCLLQPPLFKKILEIVRGFVEKYHISIYDEATQTGLLRHICIREGWVSQEVQVVLVVNGKTLPCASVLKDLLLEAKIPIVSFMLCENRENTNVIYGDTFHLLWGREYIEDTLCGIKLRLAAPAFYQVNHDATEILYRLGAEKAGLTKDDTLLDLYCGVGSIGLSMAGQVGRVIGVEIVPEAVECAKQNAILNGITNAHFYAADAADVFGVLPLAEAELGMPITPTVVVLDPPRKGCDLSLLRGIAFRNIPKIIYISCNPETLARDVAHLTTLGYVLGEVTPVNLFPRTAHVESLVCLTKQTN